MATTTRKRTPAKKAAPVTYPKFEIPEIESAEECLAAVDELIEFVNVRKGMAQDATKAQYWNGQGQALRQLRNLVTQLVPEDEATE